MDWRLVIALVSFSGLVVGAYYEWRESQTGKLGGLGNEIKRLEQKIDVVGAGIVPLEQQIGAKADTDSIAELQKQIDAIGARPKPSEGVAHQLKPGPVVAFLDPCGELVPALNLPGLFVLIALLMLVGAAGLARMARRSV